MIHIKPDRCGYTKYRCTGIPPLKPEFTTGMLQCDPVPDRPSGQLDEGAHTDLIDNYYNIPSALKGMVMTTDMVVDMSQPGLKYPEKECYDVMDPFDTAGFFDAHNIYHGKVKGKLSDMPDYVVLDNGPLCASNGQELEPGLLEPMIDAQFNPVDIEGLTAFDASLDGVMLTLVKLTQWRIKVDDKLNELSGIAARLWGVRELLNSMQMGALCPGFAITRTSGDSVFRTGGAHTTPSYSINGGNVYVNGSSVYASGKNRTGTFSAYVNIEFSGADMKTGKFETVTARLGFSRSTSNNCISVGIGSVTRVEAGGYTMYRVFQERCVVNVNLTAVKGSGVLYYDNNGASPYQALKVVECDEQSLG